MKKIGALIWAACAAFAASGQTTTNSITYTTTWFTNNPSPLFRVGLTQFDTNLQRFAELLSVEVGIYATNTFDATIENNGQSPLTFSIEGSGQATATNPGVLVLVASFSGVLASSNLPPSDGQSGSGSDLIAFHDLSSTAFQSEVITSDFDPQYLGENIFSVDVRSTADFLLSITGDAVTRFSDNRSLGLAYVTYTYTVIPEPDTVWALACCACLGLALGRHRMRRAAVGDKGASGPEAQPPGGH